MRVLTLVMCQESCGYGSFGNALADYVRKTFAVDVRTEEAKQLGDFLVLLDEKLVFDKTDKGRFPEKEDMDRLMKDNHVAKRSAL